MRYDVYHYSSGKTSETLISTDRGLLAKSIEDYPKSEDTFDEFKYKDELLEKAKRYFAKED
ncbi:43818_t:CDS:2 [Gigaspora margarita]|uniref:43818_t:CDS:1 n=1 Tax=Gigaspora margarita TaxID=4874 RepID=A0ABN7VFJ2_GIGMA|nr:43818_t:CDS:2 [Gigaspora margarita]